MKFLFSCFILLVYSLTAFSQNAKIKKAKAAIENEDLHKAKELIDQAAVNTKTMNQATTWYHRGMIYAALDTVYNTPEAMKEAVVSFNKALEIDPEQTENVDSLVKAYHIHYYSKAADAYVSDDFETATLNFEHAHYIMPSDTNAILNAAFSAMMVDDDERAVINLKRAIEAGARDEYRYFELYNYAIDNQDLDQALEVILAAKEVHPKNTRIVMYEIDIYLDQGRMDEAKTAIKNALKFNPNNPDYHYRLGIISEESGNKKNAIAHYERAIESDPEHYNSIYNLSAILFNKSNALVREFNSIGASQLDRKLALNEAIDDHLRMAMPYFEKLYELDLQDAIGIPDRRVLQILEYIYKNFKMYDKAAKIAQEIKALNNR